MTIIINNNNNDEIEEMIVNDKPCCDIFKDFCELGIVRYEKSRYWSIRVSIPMEIIDDYDDIFGTPKHNDVPVIKIKHCPFCGVNLELYYGV